MTQKFLFFILMVFSMTACVPHKNIVYFQGNTDESIKKQSPMETYKVHLDDILYIDLKSTDEKLVDLFKNSSTQNSTQLGEQTNYYTGYTVDKQGFINIPILNKINVLGFTTDEIADKIKIGLGKYFKNTDELFVLVKLSGFRYTIIGEVNNTGTKILYQNSVNIVEAIANAGDISDFGDRKNVELIRNTDDGVKKYTIDMTQVDMFTNPAFDLQPNDIINVPALKQKTLGTGTNGTQTLSTIITALSIITTTILLIKNI